MTPEEKYELLSRAFVNTNGLTKEAFIKNGFDTAFQLMPEAQKGSYFELKGDYYCPVYSQGYNKSDLDLLSFHKDTAFVEFDSPNDQEIDAFEVHIQNREKGDYSDQVLDAMKRLGTYENFRSLYSPIKIASKKIGIVCFENFTDNSFSNESKSFLKIFSQMFSNFYTMKLSQERSANRYRDIISSLVSAIELKDEYTRGHANRVMEWSVKLAKAYGLSYSEIEDIQNAAILHDVGKIGISTEILVKPGPLTEEEYQEVKKHPEKAKMILERIDGFDAITNMAYCHHEHFDGSGYPRGLKGDQTPIGAQIIQLCDAFDAMTSKRAYREAMTQTKALRIIESQSGKQFHPDLVNLLLNLQK